MNDEVCLEVWGDFACFAPPYGKVERLTYPVPTPSAVRGILSSIYAKKTEFYWQVTQIEVLSPIRYMSFQRNELKSAVSAKPDMEKSILYTDEERTQRQTQVLKNVRYRIRARICPRPSYAVKLCVEFGAARHLCSRVSGCGNLCATLKKATEAGRPSMSAWTWG